MDIPEAHIHTDHEQKEMCLLWGAKYEAERMESGLGGNAYNVSAGLDALGIEVVLVSALGEDVFGSYGRALLQKNSVDDTYVVPVAKTSVSVILNVQGDRTILGYHSGEKYQFPAQEFQQVQPKWIFLTSIGFTPFEDIYHRVLEYCEHHPTIQLAYNPSLREIKQGSAFKTVLQRTQALFVNFEEASEIANLMGYEVIEADRVTQIHGLLAFFAHLGIATTFITDGAHGAYATGGTDMYHIAPFPTKLVEKTGAGDAFTAGVIAAFTQNLPLSEALRWGAAESAYVVGRHGSSRQLLSRAALEDILRENADLQPSVIGSINT